MWSRADSSIKPNVIFWKAGEAHQKENSRGNTAVRGTLLQYLKGKRKHTHTLPKLATTARDTRDWDRTHLGCTKQSRNSLKVNLLSQRRWGLCVRLCPICEPQALVHLCPPAQLNLECSPPATLHLATENTNFGMQHICGASHSRILTSYRTRSVQF